MKQNISSCKTSRCLCEFHKLTKEQLIQLVRRWLYRSKNSINQRITASLRHMWMSWLRCLVQRSASSLAIEKHRKSFRSSPRQLCNLNVRWFLTLSKASRTPSITALSLNWRGIKVSCHKQSQFLLVMGQTKRLISRVNQSSWGSLLLNFTLPKGGWKSGGKSSREKSPSKELQECTVIDHDSQNFSASGKRNLSN